MLQSGRSRRILSIDGNFGLCCCWAKCTSSTYEGVFFEPQDRVDAFVELYKMPKSSSNKVHGRSDSVNFINLLLTFLWYMQDCNDFLAGDVIRSKSRYAALDETGVVGVACRYKFFIFASSAYVMVNGTWCIHCILLAFSYLFSLLHCPCLRKDQVN